MVRKKKRKWKWQRIRMHERVEREERTPGKVRWVEVSSSMGWR